MKFGTWACQLKNGTNKSWWIEAYALREGTCQLSPRIHAEPTPSPQESLPVLIIYENSRDGSEMALCAATGQVCLNAQMKTHETSLARTQKSESVGSQEKFEDGGVTYFVLIKVTRTFSGTCTWKLTMPP